jgi:hypothetical protein
MKSELKRLGMLLKESDEFITEKSQELEMAYEKISILERDLKDTQICNNKDHESLKILSNETFGKQTEIENIQIKQPSADYSKKIANLEYKVKQLLET